MMLKVSTILFLCGVLVIQASARTRAPTFEIRNGVLVREGDKAPRSIGRVVGGSDAAPGSAPYQVSLQWGIVRPAHFCAGTIINSNWVLTAGHCTSGFPSTGISTVVAGLNDLNEFFGFEQIRHVTFHNTWVHEEFDGYLGPHDIGLLVFQTPFVFGDFIGAVALPNIDQIHTGVATFHGWGSTSDSFFPDYPNLLQVANLPIVPVATCRTAWNMNPDPVHDDHICAGPIEGGAGACSTDSGGALVQNGEIVGVFSWGATPCGSPNRPAIYVRVSAYITWIQQTMASYVP